MIGVRHRNQPAGQMRLRTMGVIITAVGDKRKKLCVISELACTTPGFHPRESIVIYLLFYSGKLT